MPEPYHHAPGYGLLVVGFGSAEEHGAVVEQIRSAMPPLFELVTPIPYAGLQQMFDESLAWGQHAYEKAQKAGAASPTQEQIIAAFEGISFEGVGGTVRMSLGKGHQATMENAIGTAKTEGGELRIVDIKRYPPERINPPEGVKSEAWIKSGFKK